jgi:SAM-dependent methyltransferase
MKQKLLYLLMIGAVGLVYCNAPQKNVEAKQAAADDYTFSTPSTDGSGKFYMGREISLVMGAGGSEWLERDTRNQEENTERAVENLPLKANSVVADIGAGTGYYSFRIARRLPGGKLYAVEIQDEMISQLKQKKEELNDSITTIIKGTEQSPNLADNSIDLALMVDVYHELSYPKQMLQALHKALKPGGKMVLLEYRGEDPFVPIKRLHKTTVAQLNKEMGANGFKLLYKGDFLPIQHFLIYEKE